MPCRFEKDCRGFTPVEPQAKYVCQKCRALRADVRFFSSAGWFCPKCAKPADLPRDPVSGLIPRYNPNMPLPPGAVLVSNTGSPDWYWTPNGRLYYVYAPGQGQGYEECSCGSVYAAARTLGLPLAGEDLKDGEEFVFQGPPGTFPLFSDGVEILRRWERGKVRGWVCRRIEQKPEPQPAPGPVELGEKWRGYTLEFHPDRGVHAYIHRSPVDMELEGAWWKPGWKMPPANRPLLINALLTAYRRAVAKGLATITAEWEWIDDILPKDWPVERLVFLGESDGSCCFPLPGIPSVCPESHHRAALLGLCEAAPATIPVIRIPGWSKEPTLVCFQDLVAPAKSATL